MAYTDLDTRVINTTAEQIERAANTLNTDGNGNKCLYDDGNYKIPSHPKLVIGGREELADYFANADSSFWINTKFVFWCTSRTHINSTDEDLGQFGDVELRENTFYNYVRDFNTSKFIELFDFYNASGQSIREISKKMDKIIEQGGAGNYYKPNINYELGTQSNLLIMFDPGELNYLNKYMINWTSSSNGTNVTFPSNLVWVHKDEVLPNKKYKFVCINNVAGLYGAELSNFVRESYLENIEAQKQWKIIRQYSEIGEDVKALEFTNLNSNEVCIRGYFRSNNADDTLTSGSDTLKIFVNGAILQCTADIVISKLINSRLGTYCKFEFNIKCGYIETSATYKSNGSQSQIVKEFQMVPSDKIQNINLAIVDNFLKKNTIFEVIAR